MQGELIDGRYRIEKRLGVGGMSTVYLATHVGLRREVALKVLDPRLAEDPALVERFESEAIIAARFSHPHIVNVLDTGVDGRIAYLAMEYVRGKTLRQLLRDEGRLAPRQALALLDAIVEGLAAAHDAGLIHRDIKPENVLLSSGGQIKLTDFGLARAASNQTSTGNLLGTVAYISPELVEGAPADARSDIYSVGIMLYEMLTGRQPYVAETAIAVAFQHLNSEVPPPSVLLPGLAKDLDELVVFCTERDPENRPQDAEALLGEIRLVRRTLTDEQLDTPRPDTPRPTGAAPASAAGGLMTEVIGGRSAELEDSPDGRDASGSSATEVIGGIDPETSIIGSANITRALPRQSASTGTGELPVVPSETGGQTDEHLPPSKALERQAKKDDKAARRQWAREAQKPRESLGTPKSRRRGWILGVVLFILAAIVATGAWFFGMGPGSPVQIPTLTGQPVSSAVQTLAAEGVSTSQLQVYDEQVKKGRIIGTDPEQGSRIRRYQTVELLISKGPELFGVPNIVGRDEASARKALKAARVAAGASDEEYNESIGKGLVVSQDPQPDKQVRRGSKVSYVVSRGPAPVKVPDLTGNTEDDALAALESAGLTGKKAAEKHDVDVPEGSVVSQKPASGTAKRGSTVDYVVSLGPRMIEVPSVRGKQLDEAKKFLEEAGFTVQVNESSFGINLGLVATQKPSSGKQAEGSTITLGVV